ncbi:MAG: hypothetical protein AMXMBFR33_56390 [Candidatus Xenobia bacterium]
MSRHILSDDSTLGEQSTAAAGPIAALGELFLMLSRLFGLDLEKKALFFRQVATMVRAGLSIGRSLEGASNHTIGQVGKDMSDKVTHGASLAQVMQEYPQLFTRYESALVQAGEQGGTLERNLQQLADGLEKSLRFQRDLMSKLVYPLCIIHVGIFVPPLYLLVTSDLKTYLITTLTVFLTFWGSILAMTLIYRALTNVPSLRRVVDTFVLYLPLIGSLVVKIAMARFLACMAQLYDSGFLPVEAIKLSASACGNLSMEERLKGLTPLIDQGLNPAAAINKLRVLPPMVAQLLLTGEETGDPSDMMRRGSEMMDEEAQYTLKKVMVLLPVVMMLFMGVVVGAYVIHFYTRTLTTIIGQ